MLWVLIVWILCVSLSRALTMKKVRGYMEESPECFSEWNEWRLREGSGRDRPKEKRRKTIFVSCCCCNKLPQILWLKTTQMDSLTLLDIRRSKWVSLGKNQNVSRAVFLLEALREEFVSLSFSASRGHPQVLPHGPASLWPSVVTSPFVTPLLLSYTDPRNYIGPIWKIQGHFPITQALI